MGSWGYDADLNDESEHDINWGTEHSCIQIKGNSEMLFWRGKLVNADAGWHCDKWTRWTSLKMDDNWDVGSKTADVKFRQSLTIVSFAPAIWMGCDTFWFTEIVPKLWYKCKYLIGFIVPKNHIAI